MRGFKGTVQFPTLPSAYQERSLSYFESRSMTSAARKLINRVMRERAITCRRPEKLVIVIEFAREMEN